MKITEKTPPQERVFLVEMTEAELRYLKEMVGQSNPAKDRELGFPDGYGVYQDILHALGEA